MQINEMSHIGQTGNVGHRYDCPVSSCGDNEIYYDNTLSSLIGIYLW